MIGLGSDKKGTILFQASLLNKHFFNIWEHIQRDFQWTRNLQFVEHLFSVGMKVILAEYIFNKLQVSSVLRHLWEYIEKMHRNDMFLYISQLCPWGCGFCKYSNFFCALLSISWFWKYFNISICFHYFLIWTGHILLFCQICDFRMGG